MPDNLNGKTTTAAHFRDREDAHRAVIELREVDFPADTIGAAFREGASAADPAPALLKPEQTPEPSEPATTKDQLLPPETPMTTLTGGSPFGEASTYQPPPPATEDWWEGMRVALPHATLKTTSPAKSQLHPARAIAPPKDTNFEPSDRPAPAFDNDHQTGDYSYESHTFDPDSLAATLTAAGLDPNQASNIAHHISPGESIVTVSATDRSGEARSILTRNNGVLADPIQDQPTSAIAASTGSNDLRLYGVVLRHHTIRSQ